MSTRFIDPRIKLRHLTTFWEVARLRSVNGAAASLNISQPAVSKTLRELEEVLGGTLIDRSRRRITLTPFGETFFRHTSAALAALRQGIDASQSASDEVLVRIGALPTVSALILPEALRRFTADHAAVRSRIITGPNDYLLSLLRLGEVDLVIGRMADPEAMPGLSFEPLYFERVVMVVRAGHPLLAEPRFELDMIAEYPLMLPTPDSLIRRLVDSMLLAKGVVGLHNPIETVSTSFGRAYVMETDSIWLISEGVISKDARDGHVVILPVDTSDTVGPVGFTMRTVSAPLPVIGELLEIIRDVGRSIR